MLNRQQIYDIYYQGYEPTLSLVQGLLSYIQDQEQAIGRQQQITISDQLGKIKRLQSQLKRTKAELSHQRYLVFRLTDRVQQLETALQQQAHTTTTGQVERDSHNSHLPPSSDRPKAKAANSVRRTRSLRRRTGRKVGGQAGHPGTTLLSREQADRVVVHEPECCLGCGAALADSPVVGSERRQVFDLPEVRLEVSEHRAETRRCSECGVRTKAKFPQNVRGRVQYGEGVRARATYLQKYQLLPYARASEAMRDLFGCGISPAALKTVGQRCSYKLINTELRIKGELKRADVIGADETGVRVGGNNHWIHVTRTEKLTHYGYDTRRGKAAMEAINILPGYKGTLVRDGWYSYDQYLQCEHSLCNAHLLRELIYVGEVDERQKQWTEPMIKLLMEIKEEAERVRDDRQQQIMLQWQEKFVRGYEMLIASAIRINPPPGDKQAEEVPTRCEEALRLIKRLEQRRGQVLRFMTDLRVPFDNNGSERDLRMLKLQQKIAGCFRTPEGAEGFCRIRSYLSTARKQGHSLLSALERVFKGKPLILAPSTSE